MIDPTNPWAYLAQTISLEQELRGTFSSGRLVSIADQAKYTPVAFELERLVAIGREPEHDTLARAVTNVGPLNGLALLWQLHLADLLPQRSINHLLWVWRQSMPMDAPVDDPASAWRTLFRREGFTINGKPAGPRRKPVCLYRGAPAKYKAGWSWTPDRKLAEFYVDLYSSFTGRVWKTMAPPSSLLAVITTTQPEHIVDPAELTNIDEDFKEPKEYVDLFDWEPL